MSTEIREADTMVKAITVEVSKMILAKGDTLVVKVDQKLSRLQQERIYRQITGHLPLNGAKCVVIDRGMDLSVLSVSAPPQAESEMTQLQPSELASQEPTDWTLGAEPVGPGIYAVLHNWDLREGIFPDAASWDGSKFTASLNVCSFAGPFQTEQAAKDWANRHDPDA